MHIDHTALWVQNLETVQRFYLKYFNCHATMIYRNTAKRFSSCFLTFPDGGRIELMHREDITEKCKPELLGFTHVALSVGTREKVNSLTRKLQQNGVVIMSNPRVTGDGYYESVIQDPEGNLIELIAEDNCTISRATDSDLQRILYLQKCSFLQEAELYQDYTLSPLTSTLDDIRKDHATQVILKLEYRNKITGSVRAYADQETCYIGKVIVDPQYQNRGFGKLLMGAVEKEFKCVKRYELFTGSKSEKNIYFYTQLGYRQFKEQTVSGMQFVFMEKWV